MNGGWSFLSDWIPLRVEDFKNLLPSEFIPLRSLMSLPFLFLRTII